jgi:hypothetical protein
MNTDAFDRVTREIAERHILPALDGLLAKAKNASDLCVVCNVGTENNHVGTRTRAEVLKFVREIEPAPGALNCHIEAISDPRRIPILFVDAPGKQTCVRTYYRVALSARGQA